MSGPFGKLPRENPAMTRLRANQMAASNVIDRFGRPIMPGCSIVFKSMIDPVLTVVDIKPVLDHRAAAGTVVVVLQSTLSIVVRAGVPVDNMFVSQYPQAAEEEARQGDTPAVGTDEPPADGPGPEEPEEPGVLGAGLGDGQQSDAPALPPRPTLVVDPGPDPRD